MDNWGPSIWKYIHTFTLKMNEKIFLQNRDSVISHLYSVATNLPCPLCSNHAKMYLKARIKNVKSKNELVVLFYEFHNDVNKRNNKHSMEYKKIHMYESNDIYKCADEYCVVWLKHLKETF